MRTILRRPASAAPLTLDQYDIAHLAGGPRRVAETALIALSNRGAVTISGPRVRATGRPADHPVERALTALCPKGKSLAHVLAVVRQCPETDEIGHRLVSYCLLTRSRHRVTHTGRRYLEKAKQEGTFPAYVFDGPNALTDKPLRRAVAEATPLSPGLGRALIRMGRAIDSDAYDNSDGSADSGSGSGAAHSCGGGGGGSGSD
ncbi:TIGR04222 domain-containing membrane protein [Streptomyces sp. NPDC020681]|uniref:TIGR04222 domain-containing membrane protein n=1 Tax=Streptomyces sp. NPDC020681 TaxID=3365083 RepID=UPI00378C63A8